MYAHMSIYLRTILTADSSLSLSISAITARIPHVCAVNVYVCIYVLTYTQACVNDLLMTTPAKKKALLASGTLNPHPETVRSELFKLDFFDPCDRAQVKYEMLRAHSLDGDPITEVCQQFGFSREGFYQIQRAFNELGFGSLLPNKAGRKGPVKLKGEILEFALQQQQENPELDPTRLATLIKERYCID